MKLLRCVTLLLSLCTVMQVSACAGRGVESGPAGPQSVTRGALPGNSLPADELTKLPPVSSLRGASTALENNYLNPSLYSSISSAGALTNGLDLLLDAPAGELAFGVYELDITLQIPQRWLDLLLTYPDGTPDDEPVWVALADFAAGRWELHDVRSEGSTFDLSDPRYLSGAQTLSFGLLAHDGGTVTCEGIYLLASELNAAPVAALEADVTAGAAPLTVNFDASGSSDVDGNLASFRWDFDGDGIGDEFTTEPLASHSYNGGGTFSAIVTVLDVYSEQATAELTITVNGGNQSPTAVLLALPEEADPFEAVVLDASGSSDPDGSIVNFEWDTDGDGTFETDTDMLDSTAGFSFSTPGVRTLRLRITDDDGAVAQDSVLLPVHGWSEPIVPVAGLSSYCYCSAALVNGRPAFSYVNANNVLRYVRAADIHGAAWGNSVRLSNAAGVFFGSSLTVVDGRPAVAYGFYDTEKLRFVRADDADGTSWPAPVTLVDNVLVQGPKLLIVAGLPALFYVDQDTSPSVLHYMRALDSSGLTWDSPLPLDTSLQLSVGAALIGDRPAVAYLEPGTSRGLFQRADDSTGTQWNGSEEQIGFEVYFASPGSPLIETASGRAGSANLAYDDATLESIGIRYHLADTAGQNWTTQEGFGTSRAINFSLCLIAGRPALLFSDDPENDNIDELFYARAFNTNGTSWPIPELLPYQLDNVRRITLIENNAAPAALVESDDETIWVYFTP